MGFLHKVGNRSKKSAGLLRLLLQFGCTPQAIRHGSAAKRAAAATRSTAVDTPEEATNEYTHRQVAQQQHLGPFISIVLVALLSLEKKRQQHIGVTLVSGL